MLQATLHFLDALYHNIDPETGEQLPIDSVFKQGQVRQSLDKFRTTLLFASKSQSKVDISDVVLSELSQELESKGYEVTPMQLLHICRGSRRVVSPDLKSLVVFGRYRNLYSKAALEQRIAVFWQQNMLNLDQDAEVIVKAKQKRRSEQPEWKQEPFFEEVAFDQLETAKSLSLQKEVWELGLQKEVEKLPAYQLRARQKFPRAYEPWTKAEKSLLLESMCYTNQLNKLAVIFGRGEGAVKQMGQRLIWESRQQSAKY